VIKSFPIALSSTWFASDSVTCALSKPHFQTADSYS
jgi:hypothetical protein